MSLRDEHPTLPGQAIQLVEALGVAATLRLLKDRGGTRVRVPRHGDACPMLAEALGDARLVVQFASVFGDQEYVWLPKADKMLARMRDAEIVRRRERGESIRSLALAYSLTESYIKMVLRKENAQSKVRQTAFSGGGF